MEKPRIKQAKRKKVFQPDYRYLFVYIQCPVDILGQTLEESELFFRFEHGGQGSAIGCFIILSFYHFIILIIIL